MAGLLLAGGAVQAFGTCRISDWPLDIPEGTDEWIAAIRSMQASQPRIVVREVHKRPHDDAVAPASGGAAPMELRDWKAGRPPAASDRDRLMYAIKDNDVEQVSHYARLPGIDLNAASLPNSRLSPLDIALQFGYPEVTRQLIAAGAHVRAAPGETVDVHPIKTAVASLDRYIASRDRPNPFVGRPPVTLEQHVETIRILLDAGADPNEGLVPDASPSPLATLLYMPRFTGDVELARLLMAHGADANAAGSWPSPLEIAIDKGYLDYVDPLLGGRVSSATLNAALITASFRDEDAVAEKLLSAGADPNTVASRTPLLCSALRNSERQAIAFSLLAHGANVNMACGTPADGPYSPLTLADKSDHRLIDWLVDRGAQLAIPAHDRAEYGSHDLQAGPIIWSILHDADYLASKLIARDPRLPDEECGAVIYAGRFGASLTLGELFKHGADPNRTSERGITALMAAAFYDQTAAMNVLLAQPRIDIDRKTPKHLNPGYFTIKFEGSQPPLTIGGLTALNYATLRGSRDAMALLAAHGAK